MVGGVIVDIVPVSLSKWWINCAEPKHCGMQTCAVYCDPNGEPLAVGDGLWWQGDSCYWTPTHGLRADVKLRKIGFSGVRHPDLPASPQAETKGDA